MLNTKLRESLHYEEAYREEYDKVPGTDLLSDEDFELYETLVNRALSLENQRGRNNAEHWFNLAETNGTLRLNKYSSLAHSILAIESVSDSRITALPFPTYGRSTSFHYCSVLGRQFWTDKEIEILNLSSAIRDELLRVACPEFRKSIEEAEVI